MDELIGFVMDRFMVFKTGIQHEIDRLNVKFLLDSDPEIEDWSVDLDDVDKVLRVSSAVKSPSQISMMLRGLGYHCEVLD